MNVIIASDFHIRYRDNAEDKIRKETVLEFLRTLIGKTDILILNGDIFDLWFSWNNVIIKGYFSLLKTLSDLQESGCRIIFIAGNHDFWFGDFLEQELKMEIYPEFFVETIDGLRYFVAHGDRFTENDKRYQMFRSFIRNPLVMKCFKMIHPDVSLGIGMLMSRSSRNVKIPKEIAKRKEQGLFDSAKRKSAFFDIIVFGHSHHPTLEKFERGTYINTGDWIKNNSYLQIKNGQIRLEKYVKKRDINIK